MAAPAGEGHPLSLRPFPVADKKPKTVADFIARVNAQPGGFRSLSEAALREEVARQAQGDGAPDEDDVDMSDGDGDGDGEGDAVDDDDAAAQDPAQARFEVLRNIECVEQSLVHP
jgi:mediator of RNA polymerase II transcription subunit 17